MDGLARFAWFLVAGSVGLAWISATKWSGAPLEAWGHGVFLTLFIAALSAGGHDVKTVLRYKAAARELAELYGLKPEQLESAERIAAAVISRDPEAVEDEVARAKKKTGRHRTVRPADRPVTRPGDLPPRKEDR